MRGVFVFNTIDYNILKIKRLEEIMNTVYLNRNNPIVHKLEYVPVGGSRQQAFGLADVDELILEFLIDNKVRKSFSSDTYNYVNVLDSSKGYVQYVPHSNDFNDIADYQRINLMRWVVKTSAYPSGIVFDKPGMTVSIRKS